MTGPPPAPPSSVGDCGVTPPPHAAAPIMIAKYPREARSQLMLVSLVSVSPRKSMSSRFHASRALSTGCARSLETCRRARPSLLRERLVVVVPDGRLVLFDDHLEPGRAAETL